MQCLKCSIMMVSAYGIEFISLRYGKGTDYNKVIAL